VRGLRHGPRKPHALCSVGISKVFRLSGFESASCEVSGVRQVPMQSGYTGSLTRRIVKVSAQVMPLTGDEAPPQTESAAPHFSAPFVTLRLVPQ
jgi:hypothetical protein